MSTRGSHLSICDLFLNKCSDAGGGLASFASSWLKMHPHPVILSFYSAGTFCQHVALKGLVFFTFLKPNCPAAVGKLQLNGPVLSVGSRTLGSASASISLHQPPLNKEEQSQIFIWFLQGRERKKRAELLLCRLPEGCNRSLQRRHSTERSQRPRRLALIHRASRASAAETLLIGKPQLYRLQSKKR